jgi:hypothetical protein
MLSNAQVATQLCTQHQGLVLRRKQENVRRKIFH